MRVNIYAEELTQRVEIVEKNGFTGLRMYLELPVTIPGCVPAGDAYAAGYNDGSGKYASNEALHRDQVQQVSGPFMHHEGDDDSSAVTFWGKRDMRTVLDIMRLKLNQHYNDQALTMYEGQAAAWLACHDQLRIGNPWLAGVGSSGIDSALIEIRRLQEVEKEHKACLERGMTPLQHPTPRELLDDAMDRMTRARAILQYEEPSSNWGMLDVSDIKAKLE